MLSRLFFPQSPASAATRYAFAAGCGAVAFASRLLLEPLLHEQAPLLLFTLAVAVSAMRGGFGPGLFSTLLGAFGCLYFVPPKACRSLNICPPLHGNGGFCRRCRPELAGGELRHLRWEALELATQRNEILESITDGFVALDANGRFVYLNSVAGQLTRGPRDEAIGKCLWGEVPELRGSLVEDMFRQVFDKHVPIHFEYLFPLSNRWLEIHAYPAQNSGLTAYFSDVSDRKLAGAPREPRGTRRRLDVPRLLSGLSCAAQRIRDDRELAPDRIIYLSTLAGKVQPRYVSRL
jgi:PAS domain S-box-containing protein